MTLPRDASKPKSGHAAACGLVLVLALAITSVAAPVAVGQDAETRAASPLDAYVGAYRTPPQGTMSVSRFVHGENTVYLFTDYTDGWRGALRPLTGDTFAVVAGGGPPGNAEPRVVFHSAPAGAPTLELHFRDRPMRVGRRINVTNHVVTFENDSIKLSGEVVLPPGAGPHRGMVFVHGSGPATRDNYREWSYFFAANGIAVLIYDKRGAGNSTGDYRTATFGDLASDALEAVRLLRQHPKIDPDRVGLSGGSQGAWVAPIAENLDNRIAFLIPTGGGPITPATQEIYRRTRIVQDSGYAAAEVNTARATVTLYFDYLGSGGQDSVLAARVSDSWSLYSDAKWFPLLALPARDPTIGDWPEGRRRFARELHFDPTPYVRAIKTPTLAILGADDQGFPTAETAEAYRATIRPELLTVWIIPGVDHGFWVTNDAARGRHQSPDLFDGMLKWIRRLTLLPKD